MTSTSTPTPMKLILSPAKYTLNRGFPPQQQTLLIRRIPPQQHKRFTRRVPRQQHDLFTSPMPNQPVFHLIAEIFLKRAIRRQCP